MSKAVMLSVQPKYCELIASGKKTIEVRKSRPSIETPFKVYIYQTKKKWIYRLLEKLGLYQRKVIGEFICDRIDKYVGRLTTYAETPYKNKYISPEELAKTCLSIYEINDYLNGGNSYFWHITDLVIYDKPRELGEFRKPYEYDSEGFIKCGHNLCPHIGEDGQWKYDCVGGCPDIEKKYAITRPFQSWGYVEV